MRIKYNDNTGRNLVTKFSVWYPANCIYISRSLHCNDQHTSYSL